MCEIYVWLEGSSEVFLGLGLGGVLSKSLVERLDERLFEKLREILGERSGKGIMPGWANILTSWKPNVMLLLFHTK